MWNNDFVKEGGRGRAFYSQGPCLMSYLHFHSFQILIVISGGLWRDGKDSLSYRDRLLMSLNDRDVEVFTIGVGPNTDSSQISRSSSGEHYWFQPDDYNDLDNVTPKLIQAIQGSKLNMIFTICTFVNLFSL